jgi:hypothetical protein
MPFGLKNAGQTFQELKGQVGADLEFVFTYLDDILHCPKSSAYFQDIPRSVYRSKSPGW